MCPAGSKDKTASKINVSKHLEMLSVFRKIAKFEEAGTMGRDTIIKKLYKI